MRWIGNKLRSQRGATILLALLFFLLCTMVGATVLAAASSNAGRIKERQAKQQEYFTVYSALQLVCDALMGAEYQAQATVEEKTINVPENSDPTPDPNAYTYQKITYTQTTGTFSAGSTQTLNSDSIVNLLQDDLRKELDYLFATRFTKTECNGYHGEGKFQDDNTHDHTPSSVSDMLEPSAPHTLTIEVKASDTNLLPSDALPELKEAVVEVKVSLGKFKEKQVKPVALGEENGVPLATETKEYELVSVGEEKYWFFLEAKLKKENSEYGSLVMTAELKPKLVKKANPEEQLSGSFPHINNPETYNVQYVSTPAPDPAPGETRSAVKWELVRMDKE